MDKRQFAEEVIKDVRALSVKSVLSTRMDLNIRGGHAKGLCPFHSDQTVGSFVATDSRGIWKCFSCGVGGDTVKFISLFDKINYVEAAFKLALEFSIIDEKQYEEFFSKRRYTKDFIFKVEKRFTELDKKRLENDIAKDFVLDKVFRLFMIMCRDTPDLEHESKGEVYLSEEHKKYLLEERHLSEEEIKEGYYFTFPSRKGLNRFLEKTAKVFKIGVDILEKVPGFYFDKKENRYTFAKHSGLGIGIKNAKGEVVGIQIRHDKADEDKGRYFWFSSSFAMDSDKFEKGTSSGSPIDVVYPTEIKNTNVIITEGRFKAQQVAKEVGSIAISVQGVGSWRGIAKQLEDIPSSNFLKKRYNKGDFKINTLLVAFDSDMNYKVQVFEQARKMTDSLEKIGEYDFPVYYLNWNEKFGKGIDDVLILNQKLEIKRYDKQLWDEKYAEMINDILNEEPYEKINKVPSETVQTYFHKHFSDFSCLKRDELSKKHYEHIKEKAI